MLFIKKEAFRSHGSLDEHGCTEDTVICFLCAGTNAEFFLTG